MHHGDRFPSYNAYGVAAYYKPATVLVALRGVLGRDLFHKAFTEYGRRWQYKHPSPYDFFDTFDDVSGRDLSWFWRTWFFETWRLDQAIDTVATVGDSLEVGIENRGRAPMPVPLVVTRADGQADSLHGPGGRLAGRRQADHGPGGAGARGEEHRDRSGRRVSGRGPGQSAVAEVSGRRRVSSWRNDANSSSRAQRGTFPGCRLR